MSLWRLLLAWWGVTSVSRKAMRENLQRPYPLNALMLMPGGISEMFYGNGGEEQIVLRKRKGFCKLALETGACLVPVYAMGTNQVFGDFFGRYVVCHRACSSHMSAMSGNHIDGKSSPSPETSVLQPLVLAWKSSPSPEAYNRWFSHRSFVARLSATLRTSICVWSGRWGIPFSFVPQKTKMVVCIGRAIEVEKTANPSAEQVEALHDRYVAELQALFIRHKHRMGWSEDKKLWLEDENPPRGGSSQLLDTKGKRDEENFSNKENSISSKKTK